MSGVQSTSNSNPSQTTITLWEVFKFTMSFFARRKWSSALFVAMTSIFCVCEVFIPVYTGLLVDEVINQASGDTIDSSKIWMIFAALAGLYVVFWTSNMTSTFIWLYFQSDAMRHLAEEAYNKVQYFSTEWHTNTFAGSTVRKINRGMSALEKAQDALYHQLFPVALVLIGTTVYMMGKVLIIGLILAVLMTAVICVTIYISLTFVAPRSQIANVEDSKTGGYLSDAVTCNATIKSFASEKMEDQRIREQLARWREKTLGAWVPSVGFEYSITVMVVIIRFTMVGGAVMLWLDNKVTTGDIVYFISAGGILQGWLMHAGKQIQNLQKALNELEDVALFAKMTPRVRDKPGARSLVPKEGRIEFDRVGFAYQPDLPRVYDDFNLVIEPGQSVALVGKSGSGKSTFVKLLQRLYEPQVGEIRIDGQNISDVTLESLRSNITLVPQDPALFHRSLAENIAYARPNASMEEIREAARKACADEFIDALPQGYETLVGERGVKLSGGERQRVAIARAILSRAPILVLDEATSSLDSVSEIAIQKALERLMRDRTCVVIAHRLSTIKNADRILVFENGKIVEDGPHTELSQKPGGHYNALYTAQTESLLV